MAFKRTILTDEEKIYISKFNIKEPVYSNEIDPNSSVSDREKNMHLMYVSHDRFSDWNEDYFIFIWEDCYMTILFKKDLSELNTVVWDIVDIEIPKTIECNYEEIFNDLKDALKIYGFDGSVYDFDQEKNDKVIVKTKF